MANAAATRVIINADDFGMSSEVNRAIMLAFEQRLITSTTIMANMSGFAEACELARRAGLNRCIGVHLNLSDGKPLTERILACPRFCGDTGEFRGTRHRVFRLAPVEAAAVSDELEAQIRACQQQGIAPTHLDSHRHYHTEWGIGSILIKVAKKMAIHAVRLLRDGTALEQFGGRRVAMAPSGPLTGICSRRASLPKRIYKHIYNSRLKWHGLAKTLHFGSMDDIQPILTDLSGSVEIMVHPRLNGSGTLVDLDGSELRSLVYDSTTKIRFASYGD